VASDFGTQETAWDLNSLGAGAPGITPACGTFLAEAAAVCLESQYHSPGVYLGIRGSFNNAYRLTWATPTAQQGRCHAEPRTATEDGACGVAILTTKQLTGKVVVEKSAIGTGCDYWVADGDDDALFQHKVRLEVSGVLAGGDEKINARMKIKAEQTKVSDGSFPAYVLVVGFRPPIVAFQVRA
jgi:hypothetical protein